MVDDPLPIRDEEAVLYWATRLGQDYGSGAVGSPILADGYLYTYAGTKIYKIDTLSGQILAQGEMARSSAFAINAPTYAGGMIFVGLSNGGVQAFNAETLESAVAVQRSSGRAAQLQHYLCRRPDLYRLLEWGNHGGEFRLSHSHR